MHVGFQLTHRRPVAEQLPCRSCVEDAEYRGVVEDCLSRLPGGCVHIGCEGRAEGLQASGAALGEPRTCRQEVLQWVAEKVKRQSWQLPTQWRRLAA